LADNGKISHKARQRVTLHGMRLKNGREDMIVAAEQLNPPYRYYSMAVLRNN